MRLILIASMFLIGCTRERIVTCYVTKLPPTVNEAGQNTDKGGEDVKCDNGESFVSMRGLDGLRCPGMEGCP